MRSLRSCLAAVVALAALCGCSAERDTTTASDSAASTASTSNDVDVTAPADICAVVSAADISSAARSTLTADSDPGGGCTYSPEGPRDTRVSVTTTAITDDSGFDTYVAGLNATLTDMTQQDVPGVGDEATVAVGEAYGSHTATAVARIGNLLVVTMVLAGDAQTQADTAVSTLKVAVDALT